MDITAGANKVVLHHYEEFKDELDKYVISDHSAAVLKDLKLIIMTGPSSAGRNTIIRNTVATGRYNYIVSDTTRPPRINDGILEQNGVEYWFRSEEQVLADLKAGAFLEAEIIHGQQVSGISIRELEKAQKQNQIAIADVEIGGVQNIAKAKPDTITIMMLPPSFDEWQRRLSNRGRMRPDEEKRRYETALRIFDAGIKYDYFHYVISEDIQQSVAIIDAIVDGKLNPHQGRARGLIQQLEGALRDKLSTM